MTDEQKAIIENIWFDKRFAANLGTIEMLYERFELEAERREWEEYPSIKTVARYIKVPHGTAGCGVCPVPRRQWDAGVEEQADDEGQARRDEPSSHGYVVGDEHTFDFLGAVDGP